VAATIAAGVTTAFGAAVAFLTSPIGLVVLAIAVLIAIVILLVKNWDTIKECASKVWEWIKNVFSGVGQWFKDKFTEAWDNIKKIFSKAGEFFGGIWDTIKEKFSAVGSAIGDAVSGAFKTVVNSIIGFAEKTINGFIKGINKVINLVKSIPGFGGLEELKLLDIPKMASGGLPNMGQMFIAREAGPELVGNIGSSSAVVNNDQIVESVSRGVYTAVLEAMSGMGAESNTPTTINLNVDGNQFARLFLPYFNAESKMTSSNLNIVRVGI